MPMTVDCRCFVAVELPRKCVTPNTIQLSQREQDRHRADVHSCQRHAIPAKAIGRLGRSAIDQADDHHAAHHHRDQRGQRIAGADRRPDLSEKKIPRSLAE